MAKGRIITARYNGRYATTGKEYGPGTRIRQVEKGWEVVGTIIPAPEFRRVQRQDGEIKTMNLSLALLCGCLKEAVPNWETILNQHGNQYTVAPGLEAYAFHRKGDHLLCGECGKLLTILPEEPKAPREAYVPEVKVCWECGCEFTYRDCKKNGGDWRDSYCGC